MVDELFLTKKLKEVKFEDFGVSVDDYLQTQTDLDKIKEHYKDAQQLDSELTQHADVIYHDKIYLVGTVRGAINAVLSRVREVVYAQLGTAAVAEKVETGEYQIEEGVIMGGYDLDIRKDDGTTFPKNFLVLSTEEGLKEISCIGEKIGSKRYGVPIPWRRQASFVIDPREFKRASGSMDTDYAAIRVSEIAEEPISIADELAKAEKLDLIWDIDKIVDEFPPEGKLQRNDWIWVKGVAREIAPFPIFEDRAMTGQYNHLTVQDKFGDAVYAFNLMMRGKVFDDESFFPTVRMSPVSIGYTDVEWTDDMEDLIATLLESNVHMDPTDQFKALSNNIVDREFYALVKVQKIEHRRGQSRDPDKSGEKVDRYFINLNAVYVKFTDNFIPYTPPKKEEEKKEEAPSKAKPPAKKPKAPKPATPAKATAWAVAARKKILEWMDIVPNASFEVLLNNEIFDDEAFKGIDESALEKVYDDLMKK